MGSPRRRPPRAHQTTALPLSRLRVMSGRPHLSVVVVTYSQRELLMTCLESVSSALRTLEDPAELVVIDNDPRNGTGSLVRSRFPDALLVESERNEGFAGAAAEAFRQA